MLNEEKLIQKVSAYVAEFNGKQAGRGHLLEESSFKLLSLAVLYLQNVLFYCSRFQRVFCKFSYLISVMLMNVFFKGFCHPDKQGDGANGEGEDENQGTTDYNTGTGVGEGKGMQNISKEIEYEEQLLGQKGEEEEQASEENEPDQPDKEDKDEGFEMEQDFKGKNEDLGKELEDEQKDKVGTCAQHRSSLRGEGGRGEEPGFAVQSRG